MATFGVVRVPKVLFGRLKALCAGKQQRNTLPELERFEEPLDLSVEFGVMPLRDEFETTGDS